MITTSHSSRRRFAWLALTLIATFSVIASSCGSDKVQSAPVQKADGSAIVKKDGPKIVIAQQDFPEQDVLAQIYGQALVAEGYTVEYKKLGGYRDLLMAGFASGEVNFAPEYAASMLEFLNKKKGEATSDITATATKLQTYLDPLKLTALNPAPAIDRNALVVTKTGKAKDLKKMSELTPALSLGGFQDCPTNPFCIAGIKTKYGIDLSANFQALDGDGPLTVTALENDKIDVAILTSTNGAILKNKWIILDDDKGLFGADNIIPVVSNTLVEKYGKDMANFVNQISAKITTAALTDLNNRFQNDKQPAEEVAKEFLRSAGLVK